MSRRPCQYATSSPCSATRPFSLGPVANVVLMFGSMMLPTYLAPFTAALANADVTDRGVLFACSGLAGLAGIWAGGRATDAWAPDRTLMPGVGTFLATMAALTALWSVRPVPVAVVLGIVAVWGGAAFWNSPAVQARLHLLAGPVATQALALNTSGTYIGVAIGGGLGGAVLNSAGPGPLPLISGAAGLVALGLFLSAARSGKSPAPAAGERTVGPAFLDK